MFCPSICSVPVIVVSLFSVGVVGIGVVLVVDKYLQFIMLSRC